MSERLSKVKQGVIVQCVCIYKHKFRLVTINSINK